MSRPRPAPARPSPRRTVGTRPGSLSPPAAPHSGPCRAAGCGTGSPAPAPSPSCVAPARPTRSPAPVGGGGALIRTPVPSHGDNFPARITNITMYMTCDRSSCWKNRALIGHSNHPHLSDARGAESRSTSVQRGRADTLPFKSLWSLRNFLDFEKKVLSI